MRGYYRVKQTDILPCPSKGIYVTKEEKTKTIISAGILALILALKYKIKAKFGR